MTTYLYDVEKKTEKMELYQYKPKDKNAPVFIERIIRNPFDNNYFMVQIQDNGSMSYTIKKK